MVASVNKQSCCFSSAPPKPYSLLLRLHSHAYIHTFIHAYVHKTDNIELSALFLTLSQYNFHQPIKIKSIRELENCLTFFS